jgi:hypothetical protein
MVTTLQNAASTIFIKIKLTECSSVIMAEASALAIAIAAKLLNALNVQQPSSSQIINYWLIFSMEKIIPVLLDGISNLGRNNLLIMLLLAGEKSTRLIQSKI